MAILGHKEVINKTTNVMTLQMFTSGSLELRIMTLAFSSKTIQTENYNNAKTYLYVVLRTVNNYLSNNLLY
jgi:hypothetical protein